MSRCRIWIMPAEPLYLVCHGNAASVVREEKVAYEIGSCYKLDADMRMSKFFGGIYTFTACLREHTLALPYCLHFRFDW